MTAPWMPPLPEPDVIVHYTADQMRRAQADAARAALEQAAKVAHAEGLAWGRVYEADMRDAAWQCADAIRALAKEIT